MSALEKIAFFQDRRDEIPNQSLAKEPAGSKDKEGIREIAENPRNKDKNIRSDCLKVLHEIGYLDSDLIGNYVGEFLELLESRDNRMVRDDMIALATFAGRRPEEIWGRIDRVIRVIRDGTLITLV